MLSQLIKPGDKIELQRVSRIRYNEDEEEAAKRRKVYHSAVSEILSEDRLEITMPIEKAKLRLLEIDSEYDVYFFSESGLYQCFARVIDRYKTNNIYMVLMELTSNLRKQQRREYYRFGCALEMSDISLSEEEEAEVLKTGRVINGKKLNKSVIVDISGGGLRFVSEQKYEPDSLVYCIYHLMIRRKIKEYNLVGKILTVRELDNKPGFYEYRLKYINIDKDEREEIIRYIFQEERKNRKKKAEEELGQ